MRDNKRESIVHLLGVGLDNHDEHKRITRAEEFSIVGGTAETHEKMTETLIKTFEDLGKKGKRLQDAEPKEIAELIDKNTPRP